LTTDEWKISGIKSFAVVSVNKVDSRILILYNDSASFKFRCGEIILNLESVCVTNFSYYCSLSFVLLLYIVKKNKERRNDLVSNESRNQGMK